VKFTRNIDPFLFANVSILKRVYPAVITVRRQIMNPSVYPLVGFALMGVAWVVQGVGLRVILKFLSTIYVAISLYLPQSIL
jgi:hypothetical protein